MNKPATFDIAIIGGGAAGMSAAISAAKCARYKNKDLKIAIFEANDKLGKSILKTGNGRCNFSNINIAENSNNQYNNEKFFNEVSKAAKSKTNSLVIFNSSAEGQDLSAAFNMFEDLGLSCQIDAEGKMFPFTGKASSVVDVLRFAIEDLNVQVFTNHKCINFNEDKSCHFEIVFEGDKSYFSKTLIVTTGSNLIKNSGKNIRFNEFKKVLGPIKTDTKHISNLDGIRVLAKVSICGRHSVVCSEEFGEILFRKYGVSGICIFNLSRFVKENDEQYISIDFSPETNVDELSKILKSRYKRISETHGAKISPERLMAGMLLPNITKAICKYSKINNESIDTSEIKKLAKNLKNFKLKVLSIGNEKQCQINRGGINLDSLNSKTLATKQNRNLYFAGELVDIDGPCGGYNLHWA